MSKTKVRVLSPMAILALETLKAKGPMTLADLKKVTGLETLNPASLGALTREGLVGSEVVERETLVKRTDKVNLYSVVAVETDTE